MDDHFVDVWHADLVLDTGILISLVDVLDEQEKRRADTFTLPLLRNRYIAVRGISRHILANYLHIAPASLQFKLGEHGKPGLTCNTLHFNISHTDNLLLMAVGNFPDIGVDIELIKPRTNLDRLARRCFTSSEYQAWQQLPTTQSIETFYNLWTKKEAFVKAIGRGIAMGLDQCEVECKEGGQLLTIPAEYGAAKDWKITEIPVSAGVCAALVTPHCKFELQYQQYAMPSPL